MIYAGSPIAPDRLKEALDAFGPIFVQTYAGTEPGYVSCLRKEDHRVGGDTDPNAWPRRRPIPYVKIAITDSHDRPLPIGEIGEICSRQLGQLLGYLDKARTPEVLRDGWVHTGDIGYLDSDGFLYVVDRKREMIVSGGFNVFPRQVEDVLAGHPAVAQAAVIGVPHPKWGEAVHAVVVLRHGAAASADQLIAAVKEQLGSVCAPKTVAFTGALPVNPSGKVDKRALRAPFWSGRDRQVKLMEPAHELMDAGELGVAGESSPAGHRPGPLPARPVALRQRRGRRHRHRRRPPGRADLPVVHRPVAGSAHGAVLPLQGIHVLAAAHHRSVPLHQYPQPRTTPVVRRVRPQRHRQFAGDSAWMLVLHRAARRRLDGAVAHIEARVAGRSRRRRSPIVTCRVESIAVTDGSGAACLLPQPLPRRTPVS